MAFTPRTRRIAIADGSAAFLAAAAAHIAGLPGCELAGTADDMLDAVDLVNAVSPDVLLLDLGLAPARGLEVVRRVKGSAAAPIVIAMTLFSTPEGAAQAKVAGADALIGKDAFVSGLAEALPRLLQARAA